MFRFYLLFQEFKRHTVQRLFIMFMFLGVFKVHGDYLNLPHRISLQD